MAACPNQQPTANTEHSQFRWLSVLSHWLKHTHTHDKHMYMHENSSLLHAYVFDVKSLVAFLLTHLQPNRVATVFISVFYHLVVPENLLQHVEM